MWNWLAALLVAMPISFSVEPNYREDNLKILEFCLTNPENGYMMEKLENGMYIEIPCSIWLNPPAFRKYIDDCFNTRGLKTGDCLHIEV
jgi:hypothetical protein